MFFLISFFLSYFVVKYLIFCEWIHLIMIIFSIIIKSS